MTDAKAITAINDLASTRLDHIISLLAAARSLIPGHPAHDLIELVRFQAESLANDIDLLTEGVRA